MHSKADLEDLAQYILRNPFSVEKMTLESPVALSSTAPASTPRSTRNFTSERHRCRFSTHVVEFLHGLKPNQIATISMTNAGTRMNASGRVLVCSVPGPDPNEPPLNNGLPPLNPWRYNSSSPTNNPKTYDLWVDISVNGQVLRICNWNSQALIIR